MEVMEETERWREKEKEREEEDAQCLFSSVPLSALALIISYKPDPFSQTKYSETQKKYNRHNFLIFIMN